MPQLFEKIQPSGSLLSEKTQVKLAPNEYWTNKYRKIFTP